MQGLLTRATWIVLLLAAATGAQPHLQRKPAREPWRLPTEDELTAA